MPVQNSRTWAYSLPVALALLAPFNLLASLGMDIYLPVVPVMPEILGTTPDIIQLTLTLYMITLGAGQMLFGPLSDRFGRRPVLVGGALVFSAASFALAFTSTASLFVLLRLVQAGGAAAMLVAVFATVRDVYAERPESTVIYSLMNAMLAFVPALGPIAGAVLAELFGWRAVFLALGFPALMMFALVLPGWHETRQTMKTPDGAGFGLMLRNAAFWTYTLAFGTAMGTFFVFFSTAPRVLIHHAGFSQLTFSLAFASVAFVMIATARLARPFVSRWGNAGSTTRGMLVLILGAGLLALGERLLAPSFWSFILPMWLMAAGIVITSSVTANGALHEFGATAGAAVALHFCIQSLIVGLVGTGVVTMLDGDTAKPLVAYAAGMATITLGALAGLRNRERKQRK